MHFLKYNTLVYIVLVIRFLLLPTFSVAQIDTTFFDDQWTANKGLYKSYYRTYRKVDTVFSTDSLFYIEDRFMNNRLQMTGFVTGIEPGNNKLQQGQFVYYDSFGYKISEGLIKNGERTGKWEFYYASSNKIKAQKQYLNGKLWGHTVYYDLLTGLKTSEGDFADNKSTGSWMVYEGSFTMHESFFEGGRIKEYTQYYVGGQVRMKCTFTGSGHKKCVCYGMNGEETDCPEGGILIITGQERAFPLYDLGHYFKVSMVYPKVASDLGISGNVVVQFAVNEDGTISDVSLVKGIGGGCDEEALRVIRDMRPWNPLVRNNKPEKSYSYENFIFGNKKIQWLVEFR